MSAEKGILGLTEKAKIYLEKIQKDHQAKGIVVALEKAGCAGYMYRIEPCQAVCDSAIRLDFGQNLIIYIPKESVDRIKGSRLDYQKQHLETKAVFNNPNVQIACGCGDSVELLERELEVESGQ